MGKAVDEVRFRQALLLVPFQPFRKSTGNGGHTAGEVVGIYISEVKTGPMQPVVTATALPGRGLLGDRYAAKAGTFTPRSDRLQQYVLEPVDDKKKKKPGGGVLLTTSIRRSRSVCAPSAGTSATSSRMELVPQSMAATRVTRRPRLPGWAQGPAAHHSPISSTARSPIGLTPGPGGQRVRRRGRAGT